MGTLSILGLYNYDPTIFDGFALPDGLDKKTVVDNLLMELAELEIIYSSVPMMKYAITAWSAKMLDKWKKLYKTTTLEYDPISNYDRKEEWTDTGNRTADSTGNTKGTSIGNSSTDDSVAGYNSDALVPSEKSVNNNSTTTNADSTANSKETTTNTRTGRAHGNIGVTTTQEMIEEERRVASFVVADVIIQDFADRFCIGVW